MKKLKVSKKNGFSILEVLVSVVLLAIGIVAMASMQVVTIKGNETGVKISQASTFLNEKINDITSRQYYFDRLTRTYFIDSALDYNGGAMYITNLDKFGAINGSDFTIQYQVIDQFPETQTNGGSGVIEAWKELRFEVLYNNSHDVIQVNNVRMSVRMN